MYLSKLELQGFKSFAESTTLAFDPGVTTIVGPNGCGKSNIVDAIRWVIGEQRPTVLRSEKMENLIFNGTSDRRPLGMAEVELTIENTDGVLPTEYSEVTIGRRLFRDGKSEYLMNGTQCRLKDITDLFMDTGMAADAYSVIELSMVDELVSGSTEDRRRMFEEAAGITRYKMRRRQALRKLDNTQSDLERIRDLTDEISTQVERLQRQAEKAQKYKEAEAELHRLELLLSQVEYDRLIHKQEQLQEKEDEQTERAKALEAKESETEERLEELRDTLEAREATLQERREELQEHRAQVRDLEAEQRLQRERLNRARSDRDEAEQAQEEALEQREELSGQVQRLESTIEQARPALDEAEAALEEAEAERDEAKAAAADLRERVQDLREKAEAAADEQGERRRRLDQHTNRLEMLEEEQDRVAEQEDELQAKAEGFDDRLREAQSRRADLREKLEEAQTQLDRAEAEHEDREQNLDEATDRLRELERQRDAAEAEVELLDGLVSSYDELSDAVQYLATDGSLDDLKTVADVLACDDEVRVALDAALGDLASCIVVRTPEDARSAIAQLREAEKGQASFLILDHLPASVPNGEAPAGTTPLRDVVRTTDTAYDALADTLLHDCYLTDTLDDVEAAADQAEGPIRIFARTGEWVDGRGVVKGGSQTENVSPAASRLGRREQLDRAREHMNELQQKCEKQETTVEEARQALHEIDLDARRAAVREAEEALSDVQSTVERLEYEKESVEERRQELRERADEIEAERAEHREQAEALRAQVEEGQERVDALRQKRAEAEEALEEAEERERQAVDAFSDANVAAVEARNRLENLEQDLERARERIAEIDQATERRAEKIEEYQETIEAALDKQTDLDEQIEAIRSEREAHDEKVEEAEEALQNTKSEIAEVESQLRSLRQDRESALNEKNEAAVHLAEIETRIEDVVGSVAEDFERDLADDPVEVPEDFDEKEAQSEVKSLRGTINALGDVNPLALEEYEEEKERLDFLQEQKADLEEAEETLLETIEEINSTAAERFFETFDQIKDSFGDIFTELFGEGATAELALEDPDDPIDSPIEIIAKPRGKRPVTLDQLSSGEKALTATALLFSIYLVKPSPFCVLDEVDAPLDDANVERFMSLVRRFEDETQFVLVTHNQRTMALSDRMYGVTMEEQGVSTLVGVEFDEAMELTE
ncbi:chromosome segregation protein SMC [Salinibacter sp. 10B]|uniref:chromosome segregation protein SMC n=1 Tax=Salinibacter sp. 10B TaxID=1923971 RepID=UPI000CF3AED3|nr:chromosome segregation protein SMC [Salinibacter sp. 10B]PQJ34350.1 chromosome segregation protein SMC [Salinibacter sp. 10B]